MTSRRAGILSGAILLVGAGVALYFIFHSRPNPIEDTNRSVAIERPRPNPIDDTNRSVAIERPLYKAPWVISVQTVYPGANAEVVAASIAAPIEEQVNGVEHMGSMISRSDNDGNYTLNVFFDAGTDLDMAQILVQNRVCLALSVMPAIVQQQGITVRKKSPEPLVLVSLSSPDQRFDAPYLSRYAVVQIRDELARLPGVGDVALFGRRDERMSVILDAEKLSAHRLNAMDVVEAVSQRNIPVAGGPIGQVPGLENQPIRLTIEPVGRPIDPEDFGGVILKTAPDGLVVRLKDVGRIELNSDEQSRTTLNGKPAMVLGVYTLPNAEPGAVSRAVRGKLAELRADLPEGLALAPTFDFATALENSNNPAAPEHLVLDAQLPAGASRERMGQTLDRAAERVRETPGVEEVLSLTEHPFALVRNRPCLVVRLTPNDRRKIGLEETAETIRGMLQKQVPDAVFRPSVPSAAEGFPVYGFPTDFAVEDRDHHGSAILGRHADVLIERMRASGKFLAASIVSNQQESPNLHIDVDRTRCTALGVDVGEIFKTMQVALGAYYVNHANRIGRTLQVNVQVDPRSRERAEGLLKLQVKNKENGLVSLREVINVRAVTGPTAVERHNPYRIARITANLAEGVSPAEAKSLCETLTRDEFGPKQFKWIWRPAR